MQPDSAPLGLGYLASYILKESPQTQVTIIDFGAEIFSHDRWLHELQTFKPEVVGLSVLTLGYSQAMVLAQVVKEFDASVLIVAGGPHATVRPEECLYYCDVVVRGEGEGSFLEILQGKDIGTIEGISYWKNGKLFHNEDRTRIRDLDRLPFPAHHLFRVEKYKQFPGWGVIGSRGCPYNCIFCASPQLWGRLIRLRSPRNLVDEIDYLHRELGVRHIVFQDDAINMTQERAFEICDEIISRGLHKKLTFECQVRANSACVSLDLFRRMRQANIVDVTFGIESGSNRVLESLQKSLTVSEAKRAITLARKAGIPTVTGFFMVGNWGETIRDVVKTWYFVASNDVDMKLTVCTPLPGTQFESLLKQRGYIHNNVDWANVNWVTPLSRTDKMPRWCVSLLYYLTVLLLHLPASLLRGKGTKTRDLLSNIAGYAFNRVRVSPLRRRCRELVTKSFSKALRAVYGKGLGELAIARGAYRWLFRIVYPEGSIRVNGHKMYTNGDWWTSGILLGVYEDFEMELFRGLAKKGMTVVDIGANIGYYTLVAASLVGESGRVYAIEPDPTNYALLAKNVKANGYKNVTLIQKAISDCAGNSGLLLDPAHTGKHRLGHSGEGEQCLPVDVTTLDDLLGNERVDIIKMDIEGAEAKAIQGMSTIMRKNKDLKILTEFVPVLLEESGSSSEECLSKLVESGFNIYQIHEKERRLVPLAAPDSITESNLLCVRDGEPTDD